MNHQVAEISASPPDASRPFEELIDAARRYLDMLYACDPDTVDSLFHPTAQLCTLESGRPVFRSVSDYKAVLRARTAPKLLDAPRDEQIITLDLSSPSQALIKLRVRINQLVFVDYLTLARLEEGWRIVSKTYYRLSDA
jgi:hypothetical protein